MTFMDSSSRFYQPEYIAALAERACRETGGYCTSYVTKSQTTNSLYVTFEGTHSSLEVRVSDHKTSRNVATILLTVKTKEDNVVRFFKNSIERLKKRQLYMLLGTVTKAA